LTAEPLILYSLAGCPHCRAAKEYLRRRGVVFRNRDVEADSDAYGDLKRLTGRGRVPVFSRGSRVLEGFEPSALEAFLREETPETGAPGAGAAT